MSENRTEELNVALGSLKNLMESHGKAITLLSTDADCQMILVSIVMKLLDNLSFIIYGNTRDRFTNFCDKYFISELQKFHKDIMSIDLYSSRCAILHDHTYNSHFTKDNRAKKVQYYNLSKNEYLLDKYKVQDGVYINIHHFLEPVKKMTGQLVQDVISNPRVDIIKRLNEMITSKVMI
jgi:hypothetical protein